MVNLLITKLDRKMKRRGKRKALDFKKKYTMLKKKYPEDVKTVKNIKKRLKKRFRTLRALDFKKKKFKGGFFAALAKQQRRR